MASGCWAGLLEDERAIYEENCTQNGFEPLKTQHLICFSLEANYNRLYYDPTTKEVLMWANDHNFNHIVKVENQPDYTFYRIKGVSTFNDLVEAMALQLNN